MESNKKLRRFKFYKYKVPIIKLNYDKILFSINYYLITLLTYCSRRHDVNTSHENIDRFHLAPKKRGVDLFIISDYLGLGLIFEDLWCFSAKFIRIGQFIIYFLEYSRQTKSPL